MSGNQANRKRIREERADRIRIVATNFTVKTVETQIPAVNLNICGRTLIDSARFNLESTIIMLKHVLLTAVLAITPFLQPSSEFVEQISALMNGKTGSPIKLKDDDAAITKATFKPPVEIIIEAKTNSTNLRMSYAAKYVIFNWEHERGTLHIDGGPAGDQDKPGAGQIPVNKYVTIRWLVTAKKQSIFVDGQLRFEHSGDYSSIANPVSVFPAHGSEVTVKSIKVKQLPPGTE
jgi:hypothetical protein